MEWFKSNMPLKYTGEILMSIRDVLVEIEKTDRLKIACFTKIAHDGSINIFLTEDVIKNLPLDLKLRYKFQKCAPPTKQSDNEGSSLIYQFGYPQILSNPEAS
jgi:hypothetical protein